MFITAPGLVQHLHPAHVVLPQGHWAAVTLAVERPWFVLVHRVWCHGQRRSQTTLVGSDTALRDLLANIAMGDVTGLARLERCADAGAGWVLRPVQALWASAPGEWHTLGPLLLQMDGDAVLRSTDGRAAGDEVGAGTFDAAPGRRLLYVTA